MLSTVATAQTGASKPLPCPDCDGEGHYEVGNGGPHTRTVRCERCDGDGHVSCDVRSCLDTATRIDPGEPSILLCDLHGEEAEREHAAWKERERRDADLEAVGPSTASTRRILAEEGWS
jgi:hypothetical protein